MSATGPSGPLVKFSFILMYAYEIIFIYGSKMKGCVKMHHS